MIYMLLFSDDKERLMNLDGELLIQIVAKDLDEAERLAEARLYRSKFRYCLIFTFVHGPVKLAIIDKLENSIKYFSTLKRWL